MSQTAALLALLRKNGDHGVTALEALDSIGTLRLAARVADLRGNGHFVTTEMVKLRNGKIVARYRLVEVLEIPLWK